MELAASIRRFSRISRTVALAVALTAGAKAASVSTYQIVAKFPHSTESYTEGLFYLDGLLYEGVGLKGRSGIAVTELQTGNVLQRVALPEQYFGEGIVDWNSYIFQWTWQSHICFVYDRFSLQLVKQFQYSGEGWGMTRNTTEIITSDGTSTLRFRNPATFKETHSIVVKDGGKPIDQLNELEYVKGEIYANVWHSDRITRISPSDGHVIGWIDLSGIMAAADKINDESVLNGIAYDARHDRLFVTGKQWPWIYEIKPVRQRLVR